MRLLKRTAIVTAVLAATFTVASAPAYAATTCYSKSGSYMNIQRCGSYVNVSFNRPTPVGHLEIWDYNNTSKYHNGPNTSYDGGDQQIWPDAGWNDRTCVEYWYQSGGTWFRLGGEIDCTSS